MAGDDDGPDICTSSASSLGSRRGTAADPVMLEIFNNLFMSIAEQMGVVLESTAQSVNIRERLDFSCALFDPEGNLIANAPHIPVHLGSMGTSVKEVVRRRAGVMRPGDVYAVNDPYHGGTHLPDITVITPVFGTEAERDRLLFLVASRGHHAEIGGLTPGSMPAFSRVVHEEGVLFDNWLLVSGGRFREEETRRLLTDAPYPSRDPDTNLGDLRGADRRQRQRGRGAGQADRPLRARCRARLHAPRPGQRRGVGPARHRRARRRRLPLRDGLRRHDLRADHRRPPAADRRRSTSPAPRRSSTATSTPHRRSSTAAVLYVFRTLVAADIPLNDGCLRPLRLVIPAGSMLAPVYPAAVVAGNVETSQAITGTLYVALGVQAEGSGTMNNITFGNDRHQYYETVASGSGAGDGFAGESVVQTHMTNSRLTDPEVLEWRFPVLVEEFSIRRGSGGAGRWRGGDGAHGGSASSSR